MAHFYVSTENSRGGIVTASGAKSGQTTHCRGWSSGVKVVAAIDENGQDTFTIYQTHGSNGAGSDLLIGYLVGGDWRPAIVREL